MEDKKIYRTLCLTRLMLEAPLKPKPVIQRHEVKLGVITEPKLYEAPDTICEYRGDYEERFIGLPSNEFRHCPTGERIIYMIDDSNKFAIDLLNNRIFMNGENNDKYSPTKIDQRRVFEEKKITASYDYSRGKLAPLPNSTYHIIRDWMSKGGLASDIELVRLFWQLEDHIGPRSFEPESFYYPKDFGEQSRERLRKFKY